METLETRLAQARNTAAKHEWEKALVLWEAIVRDFSGEPAGFNGKGEALAEMGRLDEAEAVFTEAMRRFPRNVWAAANYAGIAVRRRDWPESLGRWDTVRQEFPKESAGFVGRGIALRDMGRPDEAEAAFADAMQRFPRNRWAAAHHAEAAARRADWPEAVRRWTGVKRRFAKFSGAYRNLAKALIALDNFSEADTVLASAAERFPKSAGIMSDYAEAAAARGDWVEACERWDIMLRRFPQHRTGYIGKSQMLLQAGQIDKAEAVLAYAASRFPGDSSFGDRLREIAGCRDEWLAISASPRDPARFWMQRYNRGFVHPALDHSRFGVPGNTVSILDSGANVGFTRTIIRFPDKTLPAATMLGQAYTAAERHHLQGCPASFTAGFTDPIAGVMFTPDHAFVTDDDSAPMLVSESFWHSQLFYNRYARNDISTDWQWRFDTRWQASETVTALAYICFHAFHYQYFHWIMDCLPRIWLFKKMFGRSAARWFIGPMDRRFHWPSVSLYDIEPEQCLPFAPDRVVRFERAMVPAFQFVEPLKTKRPDHRTGIWNIGWSEEFLGDLRERARFRYGSAGGELKIYVSRSDATHRQLRNETEVLALLGDRGFVIVTPGEYSFAEQVELFSRARVIVGAHGAGLTNLVWAPRGATIIELAPQGLRDVGYRFSSQLCGHHYTVLLCETVEATAGLAFADMVVDVGALRAALDDLP